MNGVLLYLSFFFFCSCNRNAEVVELKLVNGCGTFGHRLGSILNLGICHNISQALTAEHLHTKSVKTDTHTTVRRSTETECVKQIAELLVSLFLCETEKIENS